MGKDLKKLQKSNNLYVFFGSVFITLGLVFNILGIALFFIGNHNFDLAHNGRVFEEKSNISLLDKTSNYNLMSMTDLYIKGTNQIRQGLVLCIWGSFLFGYSLMYLIFLASNER